MPEPSILDVRLAEIDRRLRTIQADLAPVPEAAAEPPAHAAPAASDDPGDVAEPAPLPPPTPLRPAMVRVPVTDDDERLDAVLTQLHDLSHAHERLLELHRDLLAQYALVLERGLGASTTAAVTAGPFAEADNVRAFMDALAALPGVDGVDVREYLAGGRVLLEARLTSGS